jgi:hypothetical protein
MKVQTAISKDGTAALGYERLLLNEEPLRNLPRFQTTPPSLRGPLEHYCRFKDLSEVAKYEE